MHTWARGHSRGIVLSLPVCSRWRWGGRALSVFSGSPVGSAVYVCVSLAVVTDKSWPCNRTQFRKKIKQSDAVDQTRSISPSHAHTQAGHTPTGAVCHAQAHTQPGAMVGVIEQKWPTRALFHVLLPCTDDSSQLRSPPDQKAKKNVCWCNAQPERGIQIEEMLNVYCKDNGRLTVQWHSHYLTEISIDLRWNFVMLNEINGINFVGQRPTILFSVLIIQIFQQCLKTPFKQHIVSMQGL